MATAPALVFGWIDLSGEQMSRARHLISGLQQEGILDELGFLILQTAIADVLYPATTTIMTRARYFYFVPAIYDFFLEKRTPGNRIDAASRELQDKLCNVLKRTEPADGAGVIGREKGIRLQRFPSNIYWNGLKELGLLRWRVSEGSYRGHLDAFHAASRPLRDDDDALHVDEDLEPPWDPKRPKGTIIKDANTVDESTSFALTGAEAKDLFRRFERLRRRDHPSLLWERVDDEQGADAQWPWDFRARNAALRRFIAHAQALSAVAAGMTLVYYDLLLGKRSVKGLNVDGAFEDWFSNARPLLKDWDLDEFFKLDTIQPPTLRSGDEGDIRQWCRFTAAASSASSLLRDSRARQLVEAREYRKKPYKARLKFKSQLERWNPPSADKLPRAYWLDYRHSGVGRRIVADLRRGLGKD